jgi:transcriptional antiterminator RfaH
MNSWFLIQTKPRQEKIAKENLERQGYTVYLPVAPVRRRRRGRSYTEPGPMFPLYLFISLNVGVDDWGPLRSTIGVAKPVRFGYIPARVPAGLIEELKGREDAHGVQILPPRPMRTGDKVRVSEGLFEGYEAIIYAKSSKERTILLLKVIENFVKVELDSRLLEPVR